MGYLFWLFKAYPVVLASLLFCSKLFSLLLRELIICVWRGGGLGGGLTFPYSNL